MKRSNKLLFLIIWSFFILCFQVRGQSLVNGKSEKQTITVGGINSDIPGFTNRAIQIAVDALPKEGGTVKLSPGIFLMKAPVYLKSNVNLTGSGEETILKRIDGFQSNFIIDADYGETKVTVKDASGFDIGMSIQVTDSLNSECWDVSTGIITHIEENTLYFDSYLIRDYQSRKKGMVTNGGSCILVKEAQNIIISNLKIDGNKAKNYPLDGCNGGGIAILKSKNITVNKVHVTDFNGEGITWQITDSISILNCEINGCTNMGMHPGSGSTHTRIEGNNSHDNKVGLFICWRVTNSLVKANRLHNNSDYGICTGHKDTDVLFDANFIFENGLSGVVFRNEYPDNSPHRNTFTNNVVEDNGTRGEGYGFVFEGNALNVLLKDNIIRNTKNGKQKAPVLMLENAPPVKLENNTISGHSLGNGVLVK